MTFDEALPHLQRLGVEIGVAQDYRPVEGVGGRLPVDLPLIETFLPPFSPAEWLALAQRDGLYYVGGCCGQMSAVQDEIQDWFRDGGGIGVRKLADVAEMWQRHDGGSVFLNLPRPIEEISTDSEEWADPWFRLAVVWYLVKDCHTSAVERGVRPDMSRGDRAICTIDRLASALSFHRVFGSQDLPDPQAQANRLLLLARLVPALRYVLNHVDEFGYGSMTLTGWALVDLKQGEDVVCENGFGQCIFVNRTEAVALIQQWKDNEALHAGHVPAYMEIKDRIGIRSVVVDLGSEDGPRFTGPVERV